MLTASIINSSKRKVYADVCFASISGMVHYGVLSVALEHDVSLAKGLNNQLRMFESLSDGNSICGGGVGLGWKRWSNC
jgi:hypothetical protein